MSFEGTPGKTIDYGHNNYFVKSRNLGRPGKVSQTIDPYKRPMPLLSQSVEHTVSRIKSKYKLNTSLIAPPAPPPKKPFYLGTRASPKVSNPPQRLKT